MERTLNYIDPRLINHGRRVAEIVYRILEPTGRYGRRELRDICIAALLHDIGAYKTEEVDRMVSFETHDTWDHAIYGYLFFKYFSPLPELAYAVLHHHSACRLLNLGHPQAKMAQVFFLADRLDVYAQMGITDRPRLLAELEKSRDILFAGDILDMVAESGVDLPVTDEEVEGDSPIYRVLRSIPLTYEEQAAYLRMIVLFIDFRSHQTLTHTISTASISEQLGRLMGLDEARLQTLVSGAWLHDIGKTGTPLEILEKPDKLTGEEMAVMKLHVSLTDEILRGCVSDEIRHIAARHHEKLDGSGYPRSLTGPELSASQRIVAVADIFSALCGVRSYKGAFPKERVLGILLSMRDAGQLDREIVELTEAHYDAIVARMEENVKPFEQNFEDLRGEFATLRESFEGQ